MRTSEERLKLLHERADEMQRQRDALRLKLTGGASGVLAVCLISLLAVFGKSGHGITESGYAGTSLLSESAGGYVLVAVIAFAVGVVLTVMLTRHKNR